jgi:hypothetical protein
MNYFKAYLRWLKTKTCHPRGEQQTGGILMMNKLTELVKGKKTEHEKNLEELNIVSGSLAELQAKRGEFQVILQGLELEMELGEDASTKKRLNKVQAGVAKLQAEESELQERQAVLSQAISEEEARAKQAKIDEAARALEEEMYLASKRRLLENKLDALQNQLYGKSGGYSYNADMKRLAGIGGTEEFNYSDPSHAPYIEASEKAGMSGNARANKEFEKLVAEIERFIELKF